MFPVIYVYEYTDYTIKVFVFYILFATLRRVTVNTVYIIYKHFCKKKQNKNRHNFMLK